ncbi:site-specific integrase [Streptosporangium sp. NBC_01495]|uniref:tyrosine-type recombinase/integrase n=1 Tax=Streptosporangium sp. NBC_01495 TaxID=2903899 RepID=UPI002E33DB0A|nr:site-specific integrase [Streptosporangium sp. NBC_01495]
MTLSDGERKTVSSKVQKTARDKWRELIRQVEDGKPITSGRGVTLERYLNEWVGATLVQRVAADKMSESTRVSYADHVRLHIVPHLGGEQLTKLTPAQLRAWILELQKKPSARQKKPVEGEEPPPVALLSNRTVNYCHAILRAALNTALKDELISRNVAELVEPPSGKSKRGTALTGAEAEALFAAAVNDRLGVLWMIVLGLGLRRGEALSLRWDDIDLDGGVVKVGPSLQRLRGELNEETGRRRGRLAVVKSKTDGSDAMLAIPASVVTVLRQHRKDQAAEQLAAKMWVDPGLVFATSVGTAIEPRNANRAWNSLCDRAGISRPDGQRVRIHDLRHTAATWLHGEGVDMKTIQGALRHTRLATTSEIYTHLTVEVQRRAADSMDGALSKLSGKAQ